MDTHQSYGSLIIVDESKPVSEMSVPRGGRPKSVLSLIVGVCASVAFSSILNPADAAPPDVHYGSLPSQRASVCTPVIDMGLRPGLLLIHGGGWIAGDKSAYNEICRDFARLGYTVVNINYRLAGTKPENAWPAALDDARLALVWMKTNAASLGLDPKRIGIFGDSSGGQLALFLGAEGLRGGVKCVVEESGPVDLLTAPSFVAQVSPAVFSGSRTEATYRSASPVFLLSKGSAATLIVHGVDDPLVPFSQAQELLAALRKQKVPASLLAYTGGHVLQTASSAETLKVKVEEMQFFNHCLHPVT